MRQRRGDLSLGVRRYSFSTCETKVAWLKGSVTLA